MARSDERLKLVKGRLATAAVSAYVHGGSTSILSTMARSGKPDETIVRNQYLRVTAADQRAIIGELRAAKEDLSLRRAELDSRAQGGPGRVRRGRRRQPGGGGGRGRPAGRSWPRSRATSPAWWPRRRPAGRRRRRPSGAWPR